MPLVDEHGDVPNNMSSQAPIPNDSAHKSKMRKIILWLIAVVVGLPIFLFIAYWAFVMATLAYIGESSSKYAKEQQAMVEAEVARFKLPSGCTQKTRNDQPGGLDARYEYWATYDCPASKWEDIHIVLAGDLRKLGYKAEIDTASLTGPATGPADQLDDTEAVMNSALRYDSACCIVELASLDGSSKYGESSQGSSSSSGGYRIGVSKQ